MSILIRDMTMPNRCFGCIFLTTVPNFFCLAGKRDLCAEHGININRPDWCPLVEIPTPHGRLIDADEPITKISTMMQEPDYQHEGENWMIGLIMARDAIDDAPTVIKAEG